MRLLTLRFRDDELEQEYQRDSAAGSARRFRGVWAVAAVLFASGVFIDRTAIPGQVFATVEVVRFVTVGLLLIAVGLAFAYPVWFERRWQAATATAAIIVLFSMMTMAMVVADVTRPTPAQLMLATLAAVFVITTIYTISMLGIVWASVVNWLATVAYAVVIVAITPDAGTSLFWLGAANIGGMTGCYLLDRYRRLAFHSRFLLAAERAKSEALLLNILPPAIARRLREDASHIAERFDDVTILFADIAGFTSLSAKLSPEEVVAMLNRMFMAFDELADKHGLEKIKTIGDAYMVAGGLPERRDDHAEAIAEMALDMRAAVATLGTGDAPLGIRIGVNTGSAVAGVIGKKKFSYDVWGDAVNTASRMESHGIIGEIQVSETTFERLRTKYTLEPRGVLEVKGKGEMRAWLLRGRAA